MERSQLIDARVAKLTSAFGRYVRVYDEQVSFTSRQLAAHRACLALRREAGSVRRAVNDPRFVESLLQTLRAWRMGKRQSRLVSPEQFAVALQSALPELEALEDMAIDAVDLPEDIGERLSLVIQSLGIVENKAKVVAGSKALHHLLPDLVPPMGRRWTGRFFQFHLPEWQDPRSQRRIFTLAYQQFVDVARQVQPQQYVTGRGWRTCRTKIIDNAVIGFCKNELGTSPPLEDVGNQIVFEVRGYPPAKDGVNSIFGVEHRHGPRVLALLDAADHALQERPDFTPIEDGTVSMEVEVYAPPGGVLGDATNYLDGIADVLEEKEKRRGSLDHLGDMNKVWLYGDDRQIKQVSYREVASEQVRYRVTVRSL